MRMANPGLSAVCLDCIYDDVSRASHLTQGGDVASLPVDDCSDVVVEEVGHWSSTVDQYCSEFGNREEYTPELYPEDEHVIPLLI